MYLPLIALLRIKHLCAQALPRPELSPPGKWQVSRHGDFWKSKLCLASRGLWFIGFAGALRNKDKTKFCVNLQIWCLQRNFRKLLIFKTNWSIWESSKFLQERIFKSFELKPLQLKRNSSKQTQTRRFNKFASKHQPRYDSLHPQQRYRETLLTNHNPQKKTTSQSLFDATKLL